MILSRRSILKSGLGCAALPVLSRVSFAAAYPTRPVRLYVGFAAGLSSDIVARLISGYLSEHTGQQFVVENKPGAGTNIAADAAAHADPDGYTLLWVTQTNAINTSLYKSLNFDFVKDIQPVSGVLSVPAALIVNPSLPVKTVPEFIAYAKANPGKINMCSPGVGSINHVLGELFNMVAGVKLVHVPYRTNYYTDLVSGQVQCTFNPLPSALGYMKSGQVRALGVTSATRQAAFPDLPAIKEFLPDYEGTAWFGLGVRKGTPAEIVDKLNRLTNEGISDPTLKARLVALGGAPLTGDTAQFTNLIHSEIDKWHKVVEFAHMHVD
ncbi:MAG: Bug family tripartite tricarboxylate transporter substrate binding protein [Pseudolabrys sp.]